MHAINLQHLHLWCYPYHWTTSLTGTTQSFAVAPYWYSLDFSVSSNTRLYRIPHIRYPVHRYLWRLHNRTSLSNSKHAIDFQWPCVRSNSSWWYLEFVSIILDPRILKRYTHFYLNNWTEMLHNARQLDFEYHNLVPAYIHFSMDHSDFYNSPNWLYMNRYSQWLLIAFHSPKKALAMFLKPFLKWNIDIVTFVDFIWEKKTVELRTFSYQ